MPTDHPDIPQRTGKINNIGKFDALFFGVHFKQAHTMDPMCRMLLEHAYEAVVDAGVNPKQLRGSRTGVFVGACFSESEKTWFYEKLQVRHRCATALHNNRQTSYRQQSYTKELSIIYQFSKMQKKFRNQEFCISPEFIITRLLKIK